MQGAEWARVGPAKGRVGTRARRGTTRADRVPSLRKMRRTSGPRLTLASLYSFGLPTRVDTIRSTGSRAHGRDPRCRWPMIEFRDYTGEATETYSVKRSAGAGVLLGLVALAEANPTVGPSPRRPGPSRPSARRASARAGTGPALLQDRVQRYFLSCMRSDVNRFAATDRCP